MTRELEKNPNWNSRLQNFLTACTLQCNCSQGAEKGTCLLTAAAVGPFSHTTPLPAPHPPALSTAHRAYTVFLCLIKERGGWRGRECRGGRGGK